MKKFSLTKTVTKKKTWKKLLGSVICFVSNHSANHQYIFFNNFEKFIRRHFLSTNIYPYLYGDKNVGGIFLVEMKKFTLTFSWTWKKYISTVNSDW